jgi:hypothetical protein
MNQTDEAKPRRSPIPHATRTCYGQKQYLGDYPAVLDFAAHMIAKAKRDGTESEYSIEYGGPDPWELDYIRHGRKSWIDWWRDRLGIRY